MLSPVDAIPSRAKSGEQVSAITEYCRADRSQRSRNANPVLHSFQCLDFGVMQSKLIDVIDF
ncbi:hypothetical protein I6F07_05480 [Ensifer sp. IC4062]|nr:hypothetical protein [Ensifer sp. IC4062]